MTTPPPDRGVIVLDKQAGWTSHDVVARMRRVLGTRRVGHAGTLDPMATGVLVLGFGRATRLLPYLQATRKEYSATVRLGWATSTDDREGDLLGAPREAGVDGAQVDPLLTRFVGPILQRPSSVSAVKVDGRRAHQRVRSGEQVDLPARPVEIYSLERIGEVTAGPHGAVDVPIRMTCSAGTYVRAVARDLGELLGCGGHLTALRRTAVGPFGAAEAAAIAEVGDPLPPIRSMAEAAGAVLPRSVLPDQDAAAVRLGTRIQAPAEIGEGPHALFDEAGQLLAVAEVDEDRWRYRAVLV